MTPVASLSDGTAEATVLNDNYDSVVDDALASYPWNFATKYAVLNRSSGTPPLNWDGLYVIPAECLNVRCVYVNSLKVDRWEIFEDGLLVDALAEDEVVLQYAHRADEAKFHPVFVEYIVYRLASMLATGVAHDAARGELFQRQADRYYRRARWAAGSEQTPRKIDTSTLIGQR